MPALDGHRVPTEGELKRLLYEHVTGRGAAPGAALAVAVMTPGGWAHAGAAVGIRSALRPEPVSTATPWDLASVTKPFVATAAVRLVRAGRLSLDWPLCDWVVEARGTASGALPLELFLAHRAGLEAHRALYQPLADGGRVDASTALAQAAGARRAECSGMPPAGGFAPLYSDLGYLLAGAALERAIGAPLDAIVTTEVLEPLALEVASAGAWRVRAGDDGFFGRVAPTETVAWRGGEIVGQVHDENAFALSGDGISGHAGLFGSARAVAQFGVALLDAVAGRDASFLDARQAAVLVAPRAGGSLRAGFDSPSGALPAAGRRASAASFGHLGFTGTSLWCDPQAALAVALLSNRVCPSREDISIRKARPALHEALYDLVLCGRAPDAGPGTAPGRAPESDPKR